MSSADDDSAYDTDAILGGARQLDTVSPRDTHRSPIRSGRYLPPREFVDSNGASHAGPVGRQKHSKKSNNEQVFGDESHSQYSLKRRNSKEAKQHQTSDGGPLAHLARPSAMESKFSAFFTALFDFSSEAATIEIESNSKQVQAVHSNKFVQSHALDGSRNGYTVDNGSDSDENARQQRQKRRRPHFKAESWDEMLCLDVRCSFLRRLLAPVLTDLLWFVSGSSSVADTCAGSPAAAALRLRLTVASCSAAALSETVWRCTSAVLRCETSNARIDTPHSIPGGQKGDAALRDSLIVVRAAHALEIMIVLAETLFDADRKRGAVGASCTAGIAALCGAQSEGGQRELATIFRATCAAIGSADPYVCRLGLRFAALLLTTNGAMVATVLQGTIEHEVALSGTEQLVPIRGVSLLSVLVPVLCSGQLYTHLSHHPLNHSSQIRTIQDAFVAIALLLKYVNREEREIQASKLCTPLVHELFVRVRNAEMKATHNAPRAERVLDSISHVFSNSSSSAKVPLELSDSIKPGILLGYLLQVTRSGIPPSAFFRLCRVDHGEVSMFSVILSCLSSIFQDTDTPVPELSSFTHAGLLALRMCVIETGPAGAGDGRICNFLSSLHAEFWPAKLPLFHREKMAKGDAAVAILCSDSHSPVLSASRGIVARHTNMRPPTVISALISVVVRCLMRQTARNLQTQSIVLCLEILLGVVLHRLEHDGKLASRHRFVHVKTKTAAVGRIVLDWMSLWTVLFRLLRLLTELPNDGSAPLYRRLGGAVELCTLAGRLVDTFVCFGESLLSERQVDELFYEIVRNSDVVSNILVAMDETDPADNTDASLVGEWDNVRTICAHYKAAHSPTEKVTFESVKRRIMQGYTSLNLRLSDPMLPRARVAASALHDTEICAAQSWVQAHYAE